MPLEPAAEERLDDALLDRIIDHQVRVAWLGETPRLGWWRADTTDIEGGGDFFKRWLPSSAHVEGHRRLVEVLRPPLAGPGGPRVPGGALPRGGPRPFLGLPPRARAWRWELRLQDEIGPAADGTPFRIDEAGSDAARTTFLDTEVGKAVAGVEKEASRRIGKRRKAGEIGVPFEMEVHERGLWDRDALGMWNAEVALIKRNGEDVRLVTPDERSARAKLLREQPLLAGLREKALRKARKESDQQRLIGRREAEDEET